VSVPSPGLCSLYSVHVGSYVNPPWIETELSHSYDMIWYITLKNCVLTSLHCVKLLSIYLEFSNTHIFYQAETLFLLIFCVSVDPVKIFSFFMIRGSYVLFIYYHVYTCVNIIFFFQVGTSCNILFTRNIIWAIVLEWFFFLVICIRTLNISATLYNAKYCI